MVFFVLNVSLFRAACWCGNQYPSKRFKLNDSKCDVPCTGDKTKNCGGFWKLSIYATGIIGWWPPEFTFDTINSLFYIDYPIGSFIGCFNSDSFNQNGKKISKLKENDNSNRCFYICHERRYKYAAISGYVHAGNYPLQ